MEYTEEYIDLKHYWLIVRRRWLPAVLVMGGVTLLTAVVTFLQKPVYQAEGQVLLRKDSGLTASIDKSSMGALEALTQKTNPISTEIEIIQSGPIVRRVIQALQLKDSEGKPLEPEKFLKSLSVTNTKETDIISLKYKDTDPQLSMVVVNKLIELYRERNLGSMRAQATATRQFIETQLPKAENDVRRYEAAIRSFKEQSKVVSLPDEAKASVENIGDIQKSLTNYQGLLADAKARSQTLRSQLGLSSSQGLAVNALSQSPSVQKALTDLQEVRRNLATSRTQLQPGHPQILDLEEKETALKSFLGSQVGQVFGNANENSLKTLQAGDTKQKITESLIKVESERAGLQDQVNVLQNAQSTYRDRIATLPRFEQTQRELERKLGVAQGTYEALLKRLQEVRIAENQNLGNIETVSSAILPEKPISPKILLNLAIGTVMGLLLGIGTALLLESLDNTIKTVKEAQEVFDFTVLGTIPTLESTAKTNLKDLDNRATPKLSVRDDPRSAVSEAFRMLQTNLKFLSSDHPAQVIAITSSIPQEGKSTTSANLALVLNEMGHRVLIVDADLRRPSQHQIWELPNSVGLSNILVESGQWTGVVRSESELLDIITAGVIPPNPVRLIDSQRMANLIEDWRKIYDYIIIDTPPLAAASDAMLIGRMTDGVLLVARPGVLNAPSAETAKATLEKLSGSEQGQEKQVNILGLVLNGVIPENEPDTSYYYYARDYYAPEPMIPLSPNGRVPKEFADKEGFYPRKSVPKV